MYGWAEATDFAAPFVEKPSERSHVTATIDLDIAYGQGHLFGEPRAIKDAVLAEADPPTAYLRPSFPRRAMGGR